MLLETVEEKGGLTLVFAILSYQINTVKNNTIVDYFLRGVLQFNKSAKDYRPLSVGLYYSLQLIDKVV